jgi:ABC-2 type transport system permease protein
MFISNSFMTGMSAIVNNGNLVKKVYFPREILIISNTASWAFTFCIEMSVLIVVTLLFGGDPLPYLPATIYLMALAALMATGIAFFLAVANTYFRDTQHFVSIALQLLFYAAPIVYPIKLALDRRHEHPIIVGVVRWNPITHFAEGFRNTIYDGRWPTMDNTVYLTVVAVAIFCLGFSFFRQHTARMAEEL